MFILLNMIFAYNLEIVLLLMCRIFIDIWFLNIDNPPLYYVSCKKYASICLLLTFSILLCIPGCTKDKALSGSKAALWDIDLNVLCQQHVNNQNPM